MTLTALVVSWPTPSHALITGGTGNAPISHPEWPKGAAEVFNTKARIAYWEGPPFGGGQWHAECRGDAQAIGVVLADFAKLDVKNRRVVLHDGVSQSFWLNATRDPAKPVDARIDWTFSFWQPRSWERLRGLPPDLQGPMSTDADNGPPAELDVYTGGNVRWENVKVPAGIVVEDRRLAAHGYTIADGIVLEGSIVSSDTWEAAAVAAAMPS
jgi:hypothetical protein